jgi:hypothetical protein
VEVRHDRYANDAIEARTSPSIWPAIDTGAGEAAGRAH